MKRSDAEIILNLGQAISQEMPTIFGTGYELADISPIRLDRKFSFMFRFWLKNPDGSTSPLLVKIPHESGMVQIQEAIDSEHIREVIEGEFESLSAIETAISEAGQPSLFAIHPRAIFSKFNALLMEEIPIRMLKTSLAEPAIMLGIKRNWQIFESQVVLSGKWLKVIHNRYIDGQVTIQNTMLRIKMETALENIEKILPSPIITMRKLFRNLYDSVKAKEIPLTCLHNDFHLGNIFVTKDGRIGALDPNWVKGGAAYEDLSILLIDPATRKTPVLSQGLLFRKSLRKQYELAVLRGYSGGIQDSDPVLNFHCALAVLIKWLANEELLKNGDSKWLRAGSFFIAPWIRVYFHRLVKEYLKRGLQGIQVEMP